MSDTFEVISGNKNNLKAFASFNKFTIVVRESWVRAPEVSVELTPRQAIELSERLVAFARAEIDKEEKLQANRFQMGTPDVAHAGKEGDK